MDKITSPDDQFLSRFLPAGIRQLSSNSANLFLGELVALGKVYTAEEDIGNGGRLA